MTQREMRLNEARKQGQSDYRYYYRKNPYIGKDDAMASAWNDGWNQAAGHGDYGWY